MTAHSLAIGTGPPFAIRAPLLWPMPELPEVEIAARRLDAALAGAEVESALAPGMVALKSVNPPLDALVGREVHGVRRVGKMPVVEFGEGGELSLLVHMMSAGRLQVFDKRASLRDRASRVLVRLTDGRELRLREFGTKQRAWAKLLAAGAVASEEMVATLGPEAWPPPPLERVRRASSTSPATSTRCSATSATIAGIGRSWVDEILWEARLSPFKKGAELERGRGRAPPLRPDVLGDAIDHYEETIGDEVPDKMPMPLQVHRREGEPCPRCGTTIAAIHYSERSR